MSKFPFGFPVFYYGLVAERAIMNQSTVLHCLFRGEEFPPSSQWINSDAANKYISGAEAVPKHLRKELLSLSIPEVVSRIEMLRVQDAGLVASAFHAFLCEGIDIDIDPHALGRLEEVIQGSGSPSLYMAEVLRLSLQQTNKPAHIAKLLKSTLMTLHKTGEYIPDLFPESRDWLSLPALAGRELAERVGEAIPAVIQSVLVALYMDGNTDEEVLGSLKNAEFDRVAESLLQSGKMSLYEFYRFTNFLEVTRRAEMYLREGKVEEGDGTGWRRQSEFDFDWLLGFFEAVGRVTNEDMRNLWAKVLAGEVESPGSFALRTVEVLRGMTRREALAFKNACAIVMTEVDGTKFLFYDGTLQDFQLNERHGVSSGDIFTLEECGLVSALRTDNLLELAEDELSGFWDGADVLLHLSRQDGMDSFRYRSYPLTLAARQLLPVVCGPGDVDEGYILDLGRTLRAEFPEAGIAAHRIVVRNDSDVELGEDDLLDGEEE